ncbi:uncharacterized protein LOC120114297 [Hibiscus syriacus]|uniref:uncharacterized protein LOC120114297 n=1 Tax=Hibiscus syriacus TaxID=106335 RepID=UPI00192486C7|nr:uncharacterized protein LOC120114297 [Hibiscus syriacus]
MVVSFILFRFVILMETAPVKSRPLHNLNSTFFKWGTSGGGSSSNTAVERILSPESDSDHNGLRPMSVGSRSTRIHRLSYSPPPQPIKLSHREETKQREGEEEESLKPQKSKPDEEEVEEETVQRRWNLRPRKMVVIETSSAATTTVVEKTSETAAPKSMRLRVLAENGVGAEKKEKKKFRLTLMRDEIEEDIFVITGSRPSRRPRKRPKNIQKQLDSVFPGLWLVGTTPESYRVIDAPIKK